ENPGRLCPVGRLSMRRRYRRRTAMGGLRHFSKLLSSCFRRRSDDLFADSHIKLALKRSEGGFYAIKPGRVIEPEQAIHLFTVPTEPARELRPRRAALAQHDVELQFESSHGWQFNEQAVAPWCIPGRRNRQREPLAVADTCGDRLLDGAQSRVLYLLLGLAKGRYLREGRASHEERVVVVACKLDHIREHHLRPKSLSIL